MDKDKDKKKKKKKKKKDKEGDGEGEISSNKLQQIKNQMADISEYVRAIKQTFSRWYNKMNNRTGYFWGDRFKSVLIEKGETGTGQFYYFTRYRVRPAVQTLPNLLQIH